MTCLFLSVRAECGSVGSVIRAQCLSCWTNSVNTVTGRETDTLHMRRPQDSNLHDASTEHQGSGFLGFPVLPFLAALSSSHFDDTVK